MTVTNTATGGPYVYSRTNDKIVPDRRQSIGRPFVIGRSQVIKPSPWRHRFNCAIVRRGGKMAQTMAEKPGSSTGSV